MKLEPRYDEPVIRFDLDTEVRAPFLRQRERFSAALAELTAEQWTAPSRCDGWAAVDVASHLATVNGFWAWSIGSGVAGEPTRFLVDFDPQATPAALVDAARQQGVDAIAAEHAASDAALRDLVAGLDDAGWKALAEAPPGHLPVDLVVHHALWDCWVHERDVLLPLGQTAPEEPDEVLAGLRYAAALGPAFIVAMGGGDARPYVVEVSDPDARFVVESDASTVWLHEGPAPAGAATIRGRAVDVLEVLSVRTPPSGNVCPEAKALAEHLATVFT